MAGNQQRVELTDTRLQFACCRGRFGLLPQRFKLALQLGCQVVEPGEVRAHRLKFTCCFILTAAVFEDSGGFFDHLAAFGGGGVQNLIQLPLADQHVHLRPQARLRQQVLHIGQPGRGTINLVFTAAGAEHGAGNFDLC